MYLLDVKHNSSFVLNRYLPADSKMSLPTYRSLTKGQIGIDQFTSPLRMQFQQGCWNRLRLPQLCFVFDVSFYDDGLMFVMVLLSVVEHLLH